FNDALALEVSIGSGDRVGINDEVFGHLTNTGELLAGSYSACFDGMLHLFDELEIQWNSRSGIQPQNHKSVYSVSTVYTRHLKFQYRNTRECERITQACTYEH